MKRVIFVDRNQRDFMKLICKKKVKNFLKTNKVTIPYYTFKNYYLGRRHLPFDLFKKLKKQIKDDKYNFRIKIIDTKILSSEGGKKGIKTLFSKYSDSLNEWRAKGGKISVKSLNKKFTKDITIPNIHDARFAELLGAYLGDGTLTEYFMRITGDKRYDLSYFHYLFSLVLDLFGIKPKIREEEKRNQLYLEIQSKKFCDFIQGLGIKPGDKIRNQTAIPEIILKNKDLSKACIRGLIDTDGVVGKDGNAFCVRFTAYNKKLLDQVSLLGASLSIFTFKTANETGTRSKEKIYEYFKEIGSSNLRHIIRFCEFSKGNIIKKQEVLNYYDKYREIKIPFKTGL